MKVFVREAAEEDIEHAIAWIAKDNPVAATNAVSRIREQINRLEVNSLTEMGRPGRIAGTYLVWQARENRRDTHRLSDAVQSPRPCPLDLGLPTNCCIAAIDAVGH